ncbi:MAG: SMC family ATPase [Caldilineaceae bacterium]|nr:SMC family ATPase [Caldilineaceae bacterium]
MRIVSLELENTKSYHNGRIDFTDGVNAIVGHNGAGKSTILEAIGFVLFDSLNGYKHSDFVREGAKSATVVVTFISNVDERKYQVTRRCGSSNQYMVFDPDLGAKLCDGKTDVTDFLRRHMGVDPTADLTRLFSDAVGVPQGTFTAAFLQTPSQRKAIFDPLLQVEEYKEAFDKLLPAQTKLKERRQQLAIEMAALGAKLEGLPILAAAIAERQQTLAETTAQAATIDQQIQQVSQERTTLDAIQQQVLTRQKEQQQAAQQLAIVTEQARSAEQAYHEAAQAQAVVQTHEAGYRTYLTMQAAQQQLDAQQQARQQQERQVAQLEKQLSAKEAERQTLEREFSAVRAAETVVQTLVPAVTEQQELESALSLAQQQSARLQDARNQLARQEQDCQRLQERLVTLQAGLGEVQRLESQHRQLEAAIEQVRGVITANQEALARYKVEADTAKEQSTALQQVAVAQCPICEQPLTEAHRHRLIQRNEERLNGLRLQYKNQQQQIKLDEQTLQREQDTLKSIEQTLRTLPRAGEVERIQQELNAAQAALVESQTRVATFASAPAQVQEYQGKLAALGDPRQQAAIAAATVAKLPALQQQQSQLTVTLEQLRTELQRGQQALAIYQTLDDEVRRVAEALRAHLAAYQAVLSHQRLAATHAARAADCTRLQALQVTAAQEIEQQTAALQAAQAQFNPEHYTALVGQEQQLRSQQAGHQAQLTLLQKEQTRAQAELAELQLQAAKHRVLEQQATQLSEESNTLESLRALLRQAGPYITKALIKQISDGAAQIFSDLMQDYTRHLRWSEDYAIILEVDGRERQFAQLSGGEQMSAALAVRLALLREMSNIDVAFFDEPTTNLDETRRDSLARQILDVKGFRQLFVISHDDTFEQVTQNLIRIERIDGNSVVVQT